MRRAALLSSLTAALLLPASLQAHGDPASDYLLTHDLFWPFKAKIDSAALNELRTLLDQAKASGFRIDVALIVTPGDLGTELRLFGKPQRYAQLLSSEMAREYHDRLLVVMPNGYGYSVRGKPDPRTARVLAALPTPGKDATREARAAALAVRRLGAAAGVSFKAREGSSSETRDRVIIAAAALALAAGVASVRRKRARTRPA